MTKFPFRQVYDSGNEETFTKRQFIKRFVYTFNEKESDYFMGDNPEFYINDDNQYIIATEKARFLVFEKNGKSFRFVSFIVEL